jgi:hypothetical protein
VQVVALVLGQPQRVGQRADHLVGGTGTALLLQARVVIHRDPGHLGDVFPPQPGCPPTVARCQPGRGRLDPLPAAPQETGQFRAIDPVHGLILTRRAAGSQG